MRIIFMGTPDFAVPCLEALVKSDNEVVGVFTQPDKPKGRGYELTPPPVKVCALENNLEPEELETFMTSPMSATTISEMAQDLYAETMDNWDDIYEKAVYLIKVVL